MVFASSVMKVLPLLKAFIEKTFTINLICSETYIVLHTFRFVYVPKALYK